MDMQTDSSWRAAPKDVAREDVIAATTEDLFAYHDLDDDGAITRDEVCEREGPRGTAH